MITTEIRPRGGGHRDDGHEEEILQADSDTKKKVTNNDGYINLKHHKRIQTKRNKYRMGPSVLLAITYVKETAQTDLRRTSSTQVENASSG